MSNINDFKIEDGILKEYIGKDTDIIIPDGVTAVYCDAFGKSNYTIKSLHLTENVKNLELESGNGLNSLTVFRTLHALEKITVSDANKHFKVINNVLYSKDGKTLWHIPVNSEIKELHVPDTVRFLKPGAIPSYSIFVYFPCDKPSLSLWKISAPFYAPNMNFQKFSTEIKHLDVKGFAIAETKGFETNDKMRSEYLSYMRMQRKALCGKNGGYKPELVILMAKEGIFNEEMFDDCIRYFSANQKYPDVMAVLLEYKAKYFAPKDPIKEAEKELKKKKPTIADFKKEWNFTTLPSKKAKGRPIKITSYKGNDEEVIIPEKIGDHPVEIINYNAFSYNNNIKSIHIPVKCKGISQLEGCPALERITVDKKNKFYYSDNNVLIEIDEENGDTVVFSPRNNPINEYKIPDGVARIDGSAFQCNKSLEKVIVPEGCKFIGCYAFLDCKLLKEITLPESLEKIEHSAFGYLPSESDLILKVKKNSYAQQYAEENNIKFEVI